MLIDNGYVAVKKGPKENRFRPSIDALFRSAAYVCGPGAIGVVLSGALDDGTSGLWSIKRLGGIAIVQQPNQARFESMPHNALDYVELDYNLRSTEIGGFIGTFGQRAAYNRSWGGMRLVLRGVAGWFTDFDLPIVYAGFETWLRVHGWPIEYASIFQSESGLVPWTFDAFTYEPAF